LVAASLVRADEGNARIDFAGFQEMTRTVAELREARRLSEEDFIRMAAEPGTVILDARSRDMYELRHIKGALHLSFTDFTQEALEKLIPDKSTRILIYCNNNFDGDPRAFAMKSAALALNLPTFINLYGYGYRNVYELRPYLDVATTKIPFEGKGIVLIHKAEEGEIEE
jgi:hypothetical protein